MKTPKAGLVLLLILAGPTAVCGQGQASRGTVVVLPGAVEVRSPFGSDGELEAMTPTGLTDGGVVSGYATDLELEYDYRVCWRFSPKKGLEVIDPAFRKARKRVVDPSGDRKFNAVCFAAWDDWVLGSDPDNRRYFTYSDKDGVVFLDQGDPETLAAVRSSFDSPRPDPFVFWGGTRRGEFIGTLMAAHLLPYMYLPRTRGWIDLRELDSRFDPTGEKSLLVVGMGITEQRDLLIGIGIQGGGEERYLSKHDGEIISLNLPGAVATTACEPSNHEELCGAVSYDSPTDPNRQFSPWWYTPKDGVVELDLDPDIFLISMTDDGLAIGERDRRELVGYSPTLSPKPTVLASQADFRKLFPAGANPPHIDTWLTPNKHGDLLGLATSKLKGIAFERYFLYLRDKGLFDVMDILANAKWIWADKSERVRTPQKRTIELLPFAFWQINNRGEFLCPVRLDGQVRLLLVTP